MQSMHDGEFICELCFPEVTVFGEVVPGFVVVRAESDYQTHRYEEFTTSKVAISSFYHDLDIILPVAPTMTPLLHLTEAEWDRLPVNGHPWYEEDDLHENTVETCAEVFRMHPTCGHYLAEACQQAGFDGVDLIYWLIDRIARLIAGIPARPTLETQLILNLEWFSENQ